MTYTSPDNRTYAATIGFFDGVHIGHVHLLEQLKAIAAQRGLKSMAITFPEHPRQILQADYRPRLLSAPNEKIALLQASGIDYCMPFHFTTEIAGMSAYTFMKSFLQERLGVNTLLVGHDHHFGHEAGTTYLDYKKIGDQIGMDVILSTALLHEGIPVSSSRIRKELSMGNISQANIMLGHLYHIGGTVVHGLQNGRQMGFPTANLGPSCEFMQIPADGVYSALAHVDGETHYAMVNIGYRPTFKGECKTIEAHLFNFDRDIYFHELELEFVSFIRSEKKFSNPGELAAQLEHDRKTSLSTLKNISL